MKKQLLSVSLISFFMVATLVACKKGNNDQSVNYDTEASGQSEDQAQFSAQIDAVANETNTLLETSGTLAGRLEDLQSLCGATAVVDSTSNPRTITITYNGPDCFGYHTRTGVVIVSIPANVHWKDPGAAITLTYQNLVITRVADNKSITINGSHVITNVSGGLLVNLSTLNNITHTITSDGMTVSFGNNTQRTWKVARQRVFTYDNGFVITVTGTHTENGIPNVAEWGTNRFGRTFTSAITQPLVTRQDCDFRLVSGQITHTLPVFTASATFGLDASGNPTGCPGANPYYAKIIWTGPNGNSHTLILPY